MISILSVSISRNYPGNTFLLFPLLTAVCKTRVAHGSLSHEVGGLPQISTCPLMFALVMISSESAGHLPVQMSLIFSAASLVDVHPPCVLQSFVNHGAVLHKVFVVGNHHFCVERPSLKNFPSGPSGWFATPLAASC